MSSDVELLVNGKTWVLALFTEFGTYVHSMHYIYACICVLKYLYFTLLKILLTIPFLFYITMKTFFLTGLRLELDTQGTKRNAEIVT